MDNMKKYIIKIITYVCKRCGYAVLIETDIKIKQITLCTKCTLQNIEKGKE